MSKPVAIVTDSTSDIPAALVEQLHIHVIPCNVHFGQEIFRDRIDLTNEQFFQKLATSPQLPKTSQPSVGAFQELYQTLATRSSGIVSIHVAAKLSGTLQSASLAAQDITSVPIATIDSGNASMALGWLAIRAARAAQAKQNFDSIVAGVKATVPRVRLLALLENLDNVVKGGRIGKGAALLGTMLSVKPILQVKDGEVIPLEKVRTWQKAQARLVEMTKALGELEELAIIHANTPRDAEQLAGRLSEFFPRARMVIAEVGSVLGTHAGPGAIGVAVVVKES